jgi:glycogen synthase
VVTVAPSYKDEIQSVEGGFGMHDTARARSYHLDGVLNGAHPLPPEAGLKFRRLAL